MKILFAIIIISFFIACQSETDKRLEQALHLAGENRKELEKVIEHYKDDTLKLKEVQFLIENMLSHIGYNHKKMNYETKSISIFKYHY